MACRTRLDQPVEGLGNVLSRIEAGRLGRDLSLNSLLHMNREFAAVLRLDRPEKMSMSPMQQNNGSQMQKH